MGSRKRWLAKVDEEGKLILPGNAGAPLGLQPGARLEVLVEQERIVLRRSVHQLARLYVEPTNCCNLDCTTCMRNVWDEPAGMMSAATFERVLAGVSAFTSRPLVFFGGFGEPLSHPNILRMVADCKAAGCVVELITNGVLLDESAALGLLDAGLDGLWVSIDGATPQSYADVRLGDHLPQVLANVERFSALRSHRWTQCFLGIAFVAMRRNIHDLPALVKMGIELGAARFSVSNVLAHTPELRAEVLYQKALYDALFQFPNTQIEVDLPRFDLNDETRRVLDSLFSAGVGLDQVRSATEIDRCPFIAKNSASVRWDGSLSPCLALLHTHTSYLGDHPRRSEAYVIGSLLEHPLEILWNRADYRTLREKLLDFDFSPCVYCDACEMAEHNREDCFGNVLPTCGGCLWAQGLIRCP